MLRNLCIGVTALLAGCASPPPMPPVAHVDLNRFMGDWYVIAHIPSWPERNAYDAVESYRLLPDGRVQTDFRYRDGSFEAPIDTMHPVATVRPERRLGFPRQRKRMLRTGPREPITRSGRIR